MESLKKVLRIVKKDYQSKLTRAVITDLLYNRENEQIEQYIKNIIQYGCKPEIVADIMFCNCEESFYKIPKKINIMK